VAKVEESQGSYKSAAENYATAAKQGNARALNKLVAMTRAPKCEARSEAADALGTLRNKKARAALQKLAHGRFKDESRTPGIFSCSSRRAAEKALEKQRG
jgi:HEAT repeat protein